MVRMQDVHSINVQCKLNNYPLANIVNSIITHWRDHVSDNVMQHAKYTILSTENACQFAQSLYLS